MVPKAVSLTLVNYSKDNLQRELLQELYKPEVLDELLKESEYVVSRRKEVQSMVQALNKAEEYVLCLFWSSDSNPFFQDCGWRIDHFLRLGSSFKHHLASFSYLMSLLM